MANTCKHTKQPEGYIQWHAWAEKKAKHHYQVRCPNCGFWAIWKRKEEDEANTVEAMAPANR